MNNNIEYPILVERATFKLAGVDLEGFAPKDNVIKTPIPTFYLAGAGLSKSIGMTDKTTRPTSLPKELKAMLGEDFTPRPGIYQNAKGGVTRLSLWTTKESTNYYLYHSIQGNIQAIEIAKALVNTTLDMIIADAFGYQYQRYQAQEWANLRLDGIETRKTFTDTVDDYMKEHGITGKERKLMFARVTDRVNLSIFDRTAARLRQDWKVSNPRDAMTPKELKLVEQLESVAQRLMDNGYDPINAIDQARKRLLIPKQYR